MPLSDVVQDVLKINSIAMQGVYSHLFQDSCLEVRRNLLDGYDENKRHAG